MPLALEHDMTGMRINLLPKASVFVDIQNPQGGRPTDTSNVKVQVRRVDLAGEGVPETMKLNNGSGSLVQGRWQIMLAPSAAYVATDFRGPKGELGPRSIAETAYLRLGGLDQWVMIRGESAANPLLIFLHGGSGYSR